MEHERLVKELHKPARRNYTRRSYDVRGLDETWQADLVEIIPYAHDNKGYRYLLTIIDIFSKYAWAVPVKRKTCKDVSEAMKSVLLKGRVPKNLHTYVKTEKISVFSKIHICDIFKDVAHISGESIFGESI